LSLIPCLTAWIVSFDSTWRVTVEDEEEEEEEEDEGCSIAKMNGI